MKRVAGGMSVKYQDTGYGNTGCGVSRSRVKNPVEVYLKVKCSKGFFHIFWNGMMASLQNLGQF